MSDWRWAAHDGAAGICINEAVGELVQHLSYRVLMDFSRLGKSRRDRLLKALRQGFTTAYEDQNFIQALAKRFPCHIGFIGKTQAGILLAPDMSTEASVDLLERVKATGMMAGIGKEISVSRSSHAGRSWLSVRVDARRIEREEPLTYRQYKAAHLKSRLEFLKPLAVELGAATFPERRMLYAAVESGQKFELQFEGPAPEWKPKRRKKK